MSYAQPMEAFFRGARPAVSRPAVSRQARTARGFYAQTSGRQAEELVAADYAARGCEVMARRWRGQYGEIDLIVKDGATLVFVEVKKSASHDRAALRLGRRQMDRICHSALDYCGRHANGMSTDMRMDAALVDDSGRIRVIANAFGMDSAWG